MKKFRLFIRKEAYLDLENIWSYTLETWSLQQADKYYNDIIDAMNLLCEEPSIGKSADHLRNGYKSFKINAHVIFYITSNSELDIIRILHSQMDIPNRIAE